MPNPAVKRDCAKRAAPYFYVDAVKTQFKKRDLQWTKTDLSDRAVFIERYAGIGQVTPEK